MSRKVELDGLDNHQQMVLDVQNTEQDLGRLEDWVTMDPRLTARVIVELRER